MRRALAASITLAASLALLIHGWDGGSAPRTDPPSQSGPSQTRSALSVAISSGASFQDPLVRRVLAGEPSQLACSQPTLIGTLTAGRATARAAPRASARAIATFARTSEQGAPQVFVLGDQLAGPDGSLWYRALLPIRPNGTTGWLPKSALRVTWTDYRLEVDRARLRLTLYQGCSLLRQFRIGLGTKETPTPVGDFYLASLLKPPDPHTVYGTYAYGLSGFSETLIHWKDGGIIGLHGTNEPGSVGRRQSHGCIRMRNRDIEQLVRILPLGTPISIR